MKITGRRGTGMAEKYNETGRERAARWCTENAKAIGAWNDFVEKDGVPLARYRQF